MLTPGSFDFIGKFKSSELSNYKQFMTLKISALEK